MATEMFPKSQGLKQPVVRKMMDGDPLIWRMNEVVTNLNRRAYELFERRGRQNGHDLQDWLHAESELLSPMPVEIIEGDNELIVRADVPGFREKDIEIRVEANRITINCKREEHVQEKRRRTVYSERSSKEVFRVLPLAHAIDADKVKATLQDGTLEIMLPKAQHQKMFVASGGAA